MSKYIAGVSDKYDERLERLMREPVVFLHIDTTGVNVSTDHITRVTVIADDAIVYTNVFKCDVNGMNPKAASVSGISKEEILSSQVVFADELETLRAMLLNRLICCSAKDFTLDFLKKEGLYLDRDDVIDLKAIVGMMNHTYSRTTMKEVLEALLPYGTSADVPATTWERNFKMYQAACNLKNMLL